MKMTKHIALITMAVIATVSLTGCKWFKHHGGSTPDGKKLKIEWVYGGVNGANAKEDTSATGYNMKSVRFDGKTVKFEGVGGMWGNTHAKPEARNCLFFKEGDTYFGGFYEWGDPTRTSRPIDNITGKYKGWDPARLARATEFAFCVTDYSGKNRSNFAFCVKKSGAEEVEEVSTEDVITE